MRFMLSAIVETNGIWLDAGMTKIVLPPAFALASKAGPGAMNVGTARYVSRFAFAPAVSGCRPRPRCTIGRRRRRARRRGSSSRFFM